MTDIVNFWAICKEYSNNPDPEKREEVLSILKWLYPLMLAYTFGKPVEKVEHSGGVNITVTLTEKQK